MYGSYWQTALDRRLKRRRVLLATGAIAAGAALLAACGGSDSNSNKAPSSSLVTTVSDDTKNLKRGGTYKLRSTQDPVAFEAQTFVNSTATTNYCYSTLWYIKDGYLTRPNGDITGDIVDSWELSPDKLQITAKISQNAHWTPQAPTNGRVVDARDVEASWQRVSTISTRRGEFSNKASPSAPILSMTATDDRTLLIKLAQPYSTIFSLLATAAPGAMMIAPKEVLDPAVLDLRTTVRGSGPWYLSEIQPGAFYTFKRNPGYKQDKRDIPYFDQVDWPIVIDYAAALAQFRTGAIYSMAAPGTLGLRTEDLLPTKRDIPQLELFQTDMQATQFRNLFGVQPTSPFKDERVRQAYVMTWDRDLFLDTYYNVAEFKKQGLPVTTAIEGALAAGSWNGWYLDPLGKDFGPNSKYFKFDVAEAKKLLQAAGFQGAVETDINLPANGPDLPNPTSFFRIVDIVTGMVSNSGLFKLNRKDWRFQLEFQPRFRDAKGNFDGTAINLPGLPPPDPIYNLYSFYSRGGGLTQGTDSTLEDMLGKANQEFDAQKRQEIARDIQRYEGGKQFFPRIASASGFDLYWPIVRNKNVWIVDANTNHGLNTVFLDPSQPPSKQ